MRKNKTLSVILDAATRDRLLGSIDANRLILLCGAGLSIPAPSKLMSAVAVSRTCYDKYAAIRALPNALRDDVDQLAGHFYGTGEFETLFINKLVPWNDLVGTPNPGHATVADFLITRAAKAALSANFDPLIEHWASERKIAMRGALTDLEAEEFSDTSSPLLKFHGCLNRNREKTLWTHRQLAEVPIADRIQRCANWMNLKLPGSHLLVVGFWSDWGYLNDVLTSVLAAGGFQAVTVIDIQSAADLQNKAPILWARLTSVGANFKHVQASGASVLEELRSEYSRVWLKKYYALGKPLFDSPAGTFDVATTAPGFAAMSCGELYDARRDAEGVPFDRAAIKKEPSAESAVGALANILLMNATATRKGPWYVHGGKTIRVVLGAGQALSSVQAKYTEPPSVLQPDTIICAGSIDMGVPGRIVASGAGPSVVHPGPGGSATWLTLETARTVLGI